MNGIIGANGSIATGIGASAPCAPVRDRSWRAAQPLHAAAHPAVPVAAPAVAAPAPTVPAPHDFHLVRAPRRFPVHIRKSLG